MTRPIQRNSFSRRANIITGGFNQTFNRMREAAFLRKNADRWKEFETLMAERDQANPDQLADLFVQLTDDLSYARTFYPKSNTTLYLNGLTMKVHQAIYRNKKERRSRFITFWKEEVPMAAFQSQREILYALVIFGIAIVIGALSSANDSDFVRLILGDSYVNMTLENIAKGDPMGVYKHSGEGTMFAYIPANNIFVSFMVFVKGIFLSFGTVYELFKNGVMLGVFQYFFYERGLLVQSALVIWIHGTLEISAIVIAGGAGLVMGNSILFPKTYTRRESFRRGAVRGVKLIVGLIPVFIVAGFLESFVTRHTEMPVWASLMIILASLAFVIGYFVIYPRHLYRISNDGNLRAH
ncbi:MAG: stage II sporulation protein M [Candidatus Kapaibacterium sp.]